MAVTGWLDITFRVKVKYVQWRRGPRVIRRAVASTFFKTVFLRVYAITASGKSIDRIDMVRYVGAWEDVDNGFK